MLLFRSCLVLAQRYDLLIPDGRIADEVITHLVGLVGSTVRVTLEIEAEIPAGASDNVCGR